MADLEARHGRIVVRVDMDEGAPDRRRMALWLAHVAEQLDDELEARARTRGRFQWGSTPLGSQGSPLGGRGV